MSELITIVESGPVASVPAPLPSPRVPIEVRVATTGDLAFIDSLQKKASKAVGFMPTKQLEGKIAKGEIVVAWASRPCTTGTGGTPVLRDAAEPVGYLIGCDRYFKHDDVGIIYAINVVPEYRRSLVAASLLKAQFERSAYGSRLYCCWCAQDLDANRFWESMGFVPLAFRSGSRAKDRVHIFWQKRIRAGDTSTPWWFPAKTDAGSLREDRLVLPIPPAAHWGDEMPRLLPGATATPAAIEQRPAAPTRRQPKVARDTSGPVKHGPRQFGGPPPLDFVPPVAVAVEPAPPKVKTPRQKTKADPALLAAARELRDRWLERVNAGPTTATVGKYDVTRPIVLVATSAAYALPSATTRLLPAA